GPFYCPADNSIYIDPQFYDVMATQLRAPGDFAQAYVIAHEVAHHVQNLNGVLRQVHRAKGGASELQSNRLTVRVELQADCFSGVWARRTDEKHQVLERGDLREALRAAYQVGDDVLMRMGGQRVDERKFTHGSAEQRSRWFQTGFESGDLRACDTFNQPYEAL
ncbi:MAG: neutral zinc metallopeptidase, partial [Pseudomonadota bacterium]